MIKNHILVRVQYTVYIILTKWVRIFEERSILKEIICALVDCFLIHYLSEICVLQKGKGMRVIFFRMCFEMI